MPGPPGAIKLGADHSKVRGLYLCVGAVPCRRLATFAPEQTSIDVEQRRRLVRARRKEHRPHITTLNSSLRRAALL